MNENIVAGSAIERCTDVSLREGQDTSHKGNVQSTLPQSSMCFMLPAWVRIPDRVLVRAEDRKGLPTIHGEHCGKPLLDLLHLTHFEHPHTDTGQRSYILVVRQLDSLSI